MLTLSELCNFFWNFEIRILGVNPLLLAQFSSRMYVLPNRLRAPAWHFPEWCSVPVNFFSGQSRRCFFLCFVLSLFFSSQILKFCMSSTHEPLSKLTELFFSPDFSPRGVLWEIWTSFLRPKLLAKEKKDSVNFGKGMRSTREKKIVDIWTLWCGKKCQYNLRRCLVITWF